MFFENLTFFENFTFLKNYVKRFGDEHESVSLISIGCRRKETGFFVIIFIISRDYNA